MKTAVRWLLFLVSSLALAALTWWGIEAWGEQRRARIARIDAALDARGDVVRAAKARAAPTTADLVQFRDGDRRERALADVRAALASDDRDERLAALVTLRGGAEVVDEFAGGFEPLRPRLRELARDDDPATVAWAFAVLAAAGPSAPDAALAAERVAALPVHAGTFLADPLVELADHDVEGDVADALLRLLDADHPEIRQQAYGALWGARVDERVADRLVELAHSWTYGEPADVVYHAASRVTNKGEALVDLLVDRIPEQSIALYGLTFGVVDDQRDRVCDVFADVLVARTPSDDDWDRAVAVLARDGSARHAEPLRALLDAGMLTDGHAARVRAALDAIAQRAR